FILLLFYSFIFLPVSSQLVPQCTCSIVAPCYTNAADTITRCADRCQTHFISLGLTYPAVRKCILDKAPALTDVVECARKSFGDVCAAKPGPLVSKRYPETMQLAAFRQLNDMVERSGLLGEMGVLSKVFKNALGCITKCMGQPGCTGTKTCGLALPPDDQIVATFKGCAQSQGLLATQTVRDWCSCIANAGMSQLDHICSRITIT
ncbi:hypothetical protein PMAYCL1PPCAC_09895, partial [Pristionchus mayeri]